MSDARWQDVIAFWFGDLDGSGMAAPETRKRWFTKSDDFDRQIREQFADLHAELAAGGHADWREEPMSALAAVIVLDQFSRNMFRDTPEMYATDRIALEIACHMIDRGFNKQVEACMRPFVYMPLMHSESLADQERCIELFATAVADTEHEPAKEAYATNHDYAIKHRDIVAKYGRFPHRNEILGRDSSAEELAFLSGPGSSF